MVPARGATSPDGIGLSLVSGAEAEAEAEELDADAFSDVQRLGHGVCRAVKSLAVIICSGT